MVAVWRVSTLVSSALFVCMFVRLLICLLVYCFYLRAPVYNPLHAAAPVYNPCSLARLLARSFAAGLEENPLRAAAAAARAGGGAGGSMLGAAEASASSYSAASGYM